MTAPRVPLAFVTDGFVIEVCDPTVGYDTWTVCQAQGWPQHFASAELAQAWLDEVLDADLARRQVRYDAEQVEIAAEREPAEALFALRLAALTAAGLGQCEDEKASPLNPVFRRQRTMREPSRDNDSYRVRPAGQPEPGGYMGRCDVSLREDDDENGCAGPVGHAGRWHSVTAEHWVVAAEAVAEAGSALAALSATMGETRTG